MRHKERPDRRKIDCFHGCWLLEDAERKADIETLARMAARLAGRDPDEYLKMTLGDVTAFDDYIWRYPDFLNRAEAAYALLDGIAAPPASGLGPSVSLSHGLPEVEGGARRQCDGCDTSTDGRGAGSR